VLLTGLTAKML